MTETILKSPHLEKVPVHTHSGDIKQSFSFHNSTTDTQAHRRLTITVACSKGSSNWTPSKRMNTDSAASTPCAEVNFLALLTPTLFNEAYYTLSFSSWNLTFLIRSAGLWMCFEGLRYPGGSLPWSWSHSTREHREKARLTIYLANGLRKLSQR